MKIFVFVSFIVCLVTIISPVEIFADTTLDVYMNDFYSKSNEARQILQEIETSLKEGSRKKVCSRQRKAARYGIEATESLIKALKTNGTNTEIENIQLGLDKWRELRDYC